MNGKLVFGMGELGSGPHRSRVNGKLTREYRLWANMLQRCYDPKYHAKTPSYVGCTVSKRWRNFQNFAADVQFMHGFWNGGWQLDKDVLVENNKTYTLSRCCFVPSELNALFRGEDDGVSFDKNRGKWIAMVSVRGKSKNLGRFPTKVDALLVAREHRRGRLREILDEYDLDDRVVRRILRLINRPPLRTAA